MRPLTVKERILLHLFDHARHADAYEVPVDVTQEGIAKVVGIRGPHFQQYVKPLTAEALVEERTSHVIRQARRRKVYFLSPKGRQHVAALRASLLKEEVPLTTSTGELAPVPLAKVYHDERRGSTLLELVQEASSTGRIAQTLEVEVVPLADFTQEAPKVGRFYGRKQELEAVLHAIEEKPVVVVTGFAGIGKTTMGAKACDTLRGRRALFWRQVRPWDTATDLASRVATFLKVQGKVALHNLFSLPGARELSRVEELLASDLEAIHALLVFDDVHDASEDAREFLSLLVRVLRAQKGTTVLFLSRVAPGFYSQREVVLEGSVMELSLEGLDKKSSAAMLTDAHVPSALIRRFVEDSGGNPLFLQLFAAAGPQEASEKGWNTIATYIAEQVEPFLDDTERDCLEVASFYEIPVPAQGLLVEGRARTRTLVGLQRKGLLTQVGAGRHILHDTLKDYFQRSLTADRKSSLATKIVVWLMDQAEKAAERGEPLEAVGYLNNAAKLETDRSRWASITERIGELWILAEHEPSAERAFRAVLQETTEPRVQARLHGRIGQALQYSLRLDEADREVDTGLALLPAHATPEAVILLGRKADIAMYRREFNRVDEALVRAAEVADQLSDDVLRARVALRSVELRVADAKRFDFAAIETDCRMAAGVFEKARNEWLLSFTLSQLQYALLRVGRIEDALAVHDRMTPHVRASGVMFNRVEVLGTHAGILMNYRGDFAQAEALLQEKMKLAKQADLLLLFLSTHLDFANLFRLQGRYEEARESLEYYLQMTSEGELYRLTTTWWFGGRLNDLTLMARLCVRCGDTDESEKYLRQAAELSRGRLPEMSAFELAWAEASLRAAKGQANDADVSYRFALDQPTLFILARMWHEDEPRAECMLDYGRFLASHGDKERAKSMLEAALEIFTRRSMKPLKEETLLALRLQ